MFTLVILNMEDEKMEETTKTKVHSIRASEDVFEDFKDLAEGFSSQGEAFRIAIEALKQARGVEAHQDRARAFKAKTKALEDTFFQVLRELDEVREDARAEVSATLEGLQEKVETLEEQKAKALEDIEALQSFHADTLADKDKRIRAQADKIKSFEPLKELADTLRAKSMALEEDKAKALAEVQRITEQLSKVESERLEANQETLDLKTDLALLQKDLTLEKDRRAELEQSIKTLQASVTEKDRIIAQISTSQPTKNQQ